jgi:hypothetical protein
MFDGSDSEDKIIMRDATTKLGDLDSISWGWGKDSGEVPRRGRFIHEMNIHIDRPGAIPSISTNTEDQVRGVLVQYHCCTKSITWESIVGCQDHCVERDSGTIDVHSKDCDRASPLIRSLSQDEPRGGDIEPIELCRESN